MPISEHELESLIAQASDLSNAVKERLGVCQIWYDSNKVLRGLEDIHLDKEVKDGRT